MNMFTNVNGQQVRVYLACGFTDMRLGPFRLAAYVQEYLKEDPFTGALFVFCGPKQNRLKILHWDTQGYCMHYKILDRGTFPWPDVNEGTVALSPAQLGMIWEGIDWRKPTWQEPPRRAA